MARGGNVRNVTRGRRGYMDPLFGQAFDIVMQWMQMATKAMQKELYFLRRLLGYVVPGGPVLEPSRWSFYLPREIEFMKMALGGQADYDGRGYRGRGYHGPAFGAGTFGMVVEHVG